MIPKWVADSCRNRWPDHPEIRKRKEAEQKGHFFMQIDRINHISPNNALSAVLNAIEESKSKVKNEFLNYINKKPNTKEIRREYTERLKVSAENCTKQLKDFCQKHKHQLLTKKNQYLKSDDVKYLCGNCGAERNLNVKTLIETKSGFCNICKRRDFNSKRREYELSSRLGYIFYNLPIDIRDQLVKKPISSHIICPKCKKENSKLRNIGRLVDRIQNFNGFLCYYCLNTGDIKFPEGFSLGDCTQQKPHIIDVIKKTGLGDSEYWYNYVSFIKTPVSVAREGNFEIVLSLSCANGHDNKKTLRKWRKIINSQKRNNQNSFCDTCNCK
ncbi:hypothetical protein [Rheinheimera sp. UJ63]|uniref:hypothetical protein n=1 Tax=Rheinheimera sp. UJ63 TaxID=2910157 RepID=UPI001F334850|nr:hypothetical protein [Rheinheimera sp. UJ63]MCF4010607.1 hypothetical protein [Rheinheimera sp. UJ63]